MGHSHPLILSIITHTIPPHTLPHSLSLSLSPINPQSTFPIYHLFFTLQKNKTTTPTPTVPLHLFFPTRLVISYPYLWDFCTPLSLSLSLSKILKKKNIFFSLSLYPFHLMLIDWSQSSSYILVHLSSFFLYRRRKEFSLIQLYNSQFELKNYVTGHDGILRTCLLCSLQLLQHHFSGTALNSLSFFMFLSILLSFPN